MSYKIKVAKNRWNMEYKKKSYKDKWRKLIPALAAIMSTCIIKSAKITNE
jgi:hypothetical protein